MTDLLFESTCLLLIERLRSQPCDEAAWEELFRGYAPAIRRWCRGWGLQPADADDVTQAVLCKLAKKITTFRYDRSKSFRGYLKALTHFAVCDALEALRRSGHVLGEEALHDWLAIVDTRNDLTRFLESELRNDLFNEACRRTSLRADPRTWEAFRLLSIERGTGRDVAERLGMTVAAVYMAKSRVIKMIREEIRGLSRMMIDSPDRGLG